MAKKKLSSIYSKASDRAYMFVKSREGKTDRNLGSSMRLRIYEGGNKKLAQTKCNILYLCSKDTVQIPEPLLESVRIRFTRALAKLAPNAYMTKILKYPHHILRHHGMASGAKADRISQGMSNAFGKPLAKAIRIKTNDKFLMVRYLQTKLTQPIKSLLKKVAANLPFRPYLVLQRAQQKVTGISSPLLKE